MRRYLFNYNLVFVWSLKVDFFTIQRNWNRPLRLCMCVRCFNEQGANFYFMKRDCFYLTAISVLKVVNKFWCFYVGFWYLIIKLLTVSSDFAISAYLILDFGGI